MSSHSVTHGHAETIVNFFWTLNIFSVNTVMLIVSLVRLVPIEIVNAMGFIYYSTDHA